ncbi:Hpt domain-containing protein [Reinekea marinisedimentorum]|uniref:Chemotaxis protein CheA n=1 Tax=Reinekea marinisedimentorum TaxID=230495 RepID=A0A4R3ICS3_9GAMM|nr:Hpt domain-containing protein [Reinekea marinisedimentorum]TCS43217.1 chemosensory pili system protein ChpA (sensor histidine kinase/response regulator) [Reinekea marinisedimentorum]
MTERRDYVALEWVQGEIEETLKQAQFALEAFAESPDDTNRLEFSLAYIHQVFGTLQMVEFFGAALLAEEMELLNQAMVDGAVPSNNDNLAILMQAIIQLPHYLDQLKQGQQDLPIVILPLLNDLRAARGVGLLSETALFSPDLSSAQRMVGEPNYDNINHSGTVQLVRKLRQMYQLALLGWLKDDKVDTSLEFLTKSVARVSSLTERTNMAALWKIVDAFVAGIKTGHIQRSPATAKVLRDVDYSLRQLQSDPLETARQFPSSSLLKNLLFYLAKIEDSRIDRIEKIRSQYRLADSLPSEEDIKHQQARLKGPDTKAVNSVVAALLEELSRLKDSLDLMVRTNVTDSIQLSSLVAPMQQLSDTMAVVGLENPRRVMKDQLELIETTQQSSEIPDGLLMDMAGSLLYIEATLGGIASGADLESEHSDISIDVNSAYGAVIREARTGIEQVKESVVEYIGSHFDASQLAEAPAILGAIRGGLLMVPLNDAGRIIAAAQSYIQNTLINDKYRPQWSELDSLADSLVGIEYYLERISRDGAQTNIEILERAAESLNRLGLNVFLTQKTEEAPQQSDEQPAVVEPDVADQAEAVLVSAEEVGLDSVEFETDVEFDNDEVVAEPLDLDIDFDSIDESELDNALDESLIDLSDSGLALEESSDDSMFDTVIELSESDVADVTDVDDGWDDLPVAELTADGFEENNLFDQPAFDSEVTPDDSLNLFAEFTAESESGLAPGSADTVADSEQEQTAPAVEEPVAEAASEPEDDLIDDDILEIFIEEAEEVLETINEFFPRYRDNADDSEALTEFRRAFHTLKGSGRMVGALVVGETAWSVENMLNRLIDNSIQRTADLIRVVDEVIVELPGLVKAFEDKVKPDTARADQLSEIAHALSRGETVVWPENNGAESEQIVAPAEVQSAEPAGEAVEPETLGVPVAEVVEIDVPDVEQIDEPGETVIDFDDTELGSSGFDGSELEDLDLEEIELDDDELYLASEVEEEPKLSLLEIFKNELGSHLEYIESYIEDGPQNRKLPDALQRALHTIKGSAHMAAMESIADVVEPMETLVKDIQESSSVASSEFVVLLERMVSLVNSYSSEDLVEDLSVEAAEFIAQVNEYKSGLSMQSPEIHGDDASLMSIFLSESMDIVMDAESILENWRDHGESANAAKTLITELDVLSQAAKSVDLMPLSQLSNELRSLYSAAEANPYILEEKFFSLAYDGHESLISMMDRLAAGQSIRSDSMFSERLKQFYELYAIPFEVIAPLMDFVETLQAPEGIPVLDVADAEVQAQPEEALVQAEPFDLPQGNEQALNLQAERLSVDGDPDLVGIFLEEANDILESIQTSLEQWSYDPQNTLEVESLQRDLHTLKGGARMAEVSPLGDLAHELEYLYEGLAQGQYQYSESLLGLLQQCHDRLASMVGDIESSMTCMSAPDLVEAIARFRKNPGAPLQPVVLTPVQPEMPEQGVSLEPENTVVESNTYDQPAEPQAEFEAELTDPVLDDLPEEGQLTPTVELNLAEDVDYDILEIFIDEAGELLHELENAIEEWRSNPDNEAHADEMKRVLHTLKGGSRLARLLELGDQSHDFETFIIRAQQDKLPLDDAFFAEVLNRQDQLVSYVEALQHMMQQQGADAGGFGPSVIQMVPELDEDDSTEDSAVAAESPVEENTPVESTLPVVAEPAENVGLTVVENAPESNVLPFKAKVASPDSAKPATAKRNLPQETVKVNASLLEGLVNLAGETSISRARLEQEVSDFSFTLTEMDQTIDRLRDHVRRLDMETEAQIIFRQERAEETNYEDFDPLEMDRYSQIQQLSRSLMEATYDLNDIKSTLTDKTRDAETILLQQSRINTELQEGLMRTRMVPFNRLLPRLRRIVRQVSGELGKQVDFMVGNAEGEVDRSVLERMISPLEHLLRNAVDHGIEMPEVRESNGKPGKGIVRLNLSREGSEIVLRLEDDGKGLDEDAIRTKAVERGLMQEGASLNSQEIMQFILEAGFSTSDKVTQISGRGVGMDVVNSEVKQLGGSISIDSEFGRGTLFTIRLPFTVSVNRALMVKSQDDLYALPLTSIEGIVRVTPKQLEEYYQPNAPMFEYGGGRYRLEYLGSLLHTAARPNTSLIETSVPLVLVRGSDDRHSMALHVDRLLGSREIVVKTLGSQFNKVPGVTGATILGDGSVVVILDLSALIRSDLVLAHFAEPVAALEAPDQERRKEGPAKIMVCDDSVTVRKVTSRLLERNGMDVMLAKHGADAINQMIEEIPDLILLDIEMPYMDGFEVASRVRHDERLKHVPIIMITSRTGSKHRERAISIGVNEYIGKPFQEGPLLETIDRLLSEQ